MSSSVLCYIACPWKIPWKIPDLLAAALSRYVLPPIEYLNFVPRFTLKHVFLIVALAAIAWFVGSNVQLDPLAPETHLRYYARCKSRFPNCMVAHFPPQLPSGAKLFYYTNGPLQATEAMQLLVETTPEEIDRLRAHFSPVAVETFVGFDEKLYGTTDANMKLGYPQRVFSANHVNHFRNSLAV